MPEGDTVFQTAARLREALVGAVLTRTDIRVPRFAAVDLSGRRVDEVLSRGKHLFIRVGDASIHSHLLMDGRWQLGAPRAPAHKIRIVLEAQTESGIVRAFGIDLGVLEILTREADLDAVAHLGPDLLGPDWDPGVAAANLSAAPDRALAEALLDQRVLAGIGNVYANELCFLFGRLPLAHVGTLTDPLRLVDKAHRMLTANRDRVSRTTTGDTRRGRELWVYGRQGQPCRRCGTAISVDRDGDRVTYWCGHCQR
ncbi:MAG TPA: endonuclease VIII Nei2 [Mycobacterium sp.]|nr:endonuclease VIII Nei2 [Mycobacterium sp.]